MIRVAVLPRRPSAGGTPPPSAVGITMSLRAVPDSDEPGPPPPRGPDSGRNALMTHSLRFASLLIVLHAFVVPARSDEARPRPITRNVVLVTTDGLRWQEVFRGADDALLNKKDGGVADPDALRRAFWRETPEARREALLPFLWTTVARRGQLFGNRDKKSLAYVTNGKNFSYPGYNEMFTGSPDPRIDSNAKRPNPNVSVLEWLHRKPAFRGEVAAVASWDLFPFILNVEVPVHQCSRSSCTEDYARTGPLANVRAIDCPRRDLRLPSP